MQDENRKEKRFNITTPISLKIFDDSRRNIALGLTENMSLGGLLIEVTNWIMPELLKLNNSVFIKFFLPNDGPVIELTGTILRFNGADAEDRPKSIAVCFEEIPAETMQLMREFIH